MSDNIEVTRIANIQPCWKDAMQELIEDGSTKYIGLSRNVDYRLLVGENSIEEDLVKEVNYWASRFLWDIAVSSFPVTVESLTVKIIKNRWDAHCRLEMIISKVKNE
jgi:hypothetical protein